MSHFKPAVCSLTTEDTYKGPQLVNRCAAGSPPSSQDGMRVSAISSTCIPLVSHGNLRTAQSARSAQAAEAGAAHRWQAGTALFTQNACVPAGRAHLQGHGCMRTCRMGLPGQAPCPQEW